MSSVLGDVAERVRRVEARLERLLASGWRSAAAEAADVEEDAAALDSLGLPTLAAGVRRVPAATDGADALAAIAVALAACRQVRARLAAGEIVVTSGEDKWAPLAPERRSARTEDRLIPVGRLAVGPGEEAWACVRLRGQWADRYVLVDPPAVLDGGAEPTWLGCVLEGVLAWQARYPLGAEGSVDRCRLGGAKVVAEAPDGLLQALSKPYKEGLTLLGGSGGLRLRHLERAEASTYVWPDPTAAQAFAGARQDKVWALTWAGGAIAPLALLSPPGFFKRPKLVHLIPGLPETPLG
jgi:hypothetical protein